MSLGGYFGILRHGFMSNLGAPSVRRVMLVMENPVEYYMYPPLHLLSEALKLSQYERTDALLELINTLQRHLYLFSFHEQLQIVNLCNAYNLEIQDYASTNVLREALRAGSKI